MSATAVKRSLMTAEEVKQMVEEMVLVARAQNLYHDMMASDNFLFSGDWSFILGEHNDDDDDDDDEYSPYDSEDDEDWDDDEDSDDDDDDSDEEGDEYWG